MSTSNLDLELIRIDGDTQPRQSISNETVAEYADEMREGDQFPEVTVFFDGKDYWLADGFHRWHGARRAGQEKIRANVLRGTQEDARWHATGANKAHGLRRTNADKARAVRLALAHPKAAGKSSREIARHCGVSNRMVDGYRQKSGKANPHGKASGKLSQNRTQVVAGQGPGKSDIDPDSIPMGDESEAQAGHEEAAKIVADFRDRGFPDDRIELIARTRPEPVRSAILALLADSDKPGDMTEPDAGPVDQAGAPIPAKLRPDFERREEITRLMGIISNLKTAVLAKRSSGDPLYADLNPSQFKAECENVYRTLRSLRPHAVCVYCVGDGCKACLNRGWLGEFSYAAAPEDMKHAG